MKAEYFEGDWEAVFQFVRAFNSKYGELPKLSTVKSKFKGQAFLKAAEPAAYYAKELRTRHAFGILDEGLRTKYTSTRTSNDLDGSVDALKGVVLAVQRLGLKDASSGPVRISRNTVQRKKDYLERKKSKGMLGIPTPWKSLDEVTQGWQPGDLVVVLARAGIGKTFFAIKNELAAQKAGSNGLFTSMEMYPKRLGIRYDGIGAGISVERFRKGRLTKQELMKLDKWYARLGTSKSWGQVDLCGPNEISSPLDLELSIQLGAYNFVVWDSFYLAAKKKKWEEFAQLIADIKKVATRTGVPIMVTSQFNKEVRETHTKADQVAAAFTDSILHDADFVFALFQTPSMKLMKEMLLRSLKVREGIELNELLLKWDIDNGNFSEVSSSVSGANMKLDEEIDSEVPLSYEYE
jgi:replicative DNA helicase